ncbi:MAG TPA: rhomboid family intramembrane serine protease [Candidatus Angelobacter sp.]
MPQCLKCGAELQVNEEGIAPVLCDRCAGVATSRARRGMSTGTLRDYPATTLLVGINVAVLLGMIMTGGASGIFSGPNLIRWGANVGPLTYSGEYWRLIMAGFIHGSFMHIAFNMWCLWSLGQLSEKLFGTWITVAVYLLTGVGGSMLSIFWNPRQFEVGASGAIFGICGAILSGIKFGNVSVSAWQKRSITSSLVFFAGFNLFLGASLPGIDNVCHIGGLITGLIFGIPLATANASGKKSFEWLTMVLAAAVLAVLGMRVIGVKGEPIRLHQAAQNEIQQHNYAAAIRLLEPAIAANPDDALGQALLGDAYRANGERDKAVAAYKIAVQLDPNDQESQQALQELEAMKALEENSPTKKAPPR